jgi:hypothetical protein
MLNNSIINVNKSQMSNLKYCYFENNEVKNVDIIDLSYNLDNINDNITSLFCY